MFRCYNFLVFIYLLNLIQKHYQDNISTISNNKNLSNIYKVKVIILTIKKIIILTTIMYLEKEFSSKIKIVNYILLLYRIKFSVFYIICSDIKSVKIS